MSMAMCNAIKYNFVVFGSDWEFYRRAYSDVIGLDYVRYITPSHGNALLRKIRNIHLSEEINKIITLPFKSLWNGLYFHDDFNVKRPLCFIVFYDWYVKNNGFIEYLRKAYPKSKIVTVFHDLIDAKRMSYSGDYLDMKYLKNLCDKVVTYDFKEAEKYNLTYHAIPYSQQAQDNYKDEDLSSDVYFLGQAKNRLDTIMSIYKQLKRLNIKLKFILSGVPEDMRINEDGLEYLDSNTVSYSDNLRYIANTKCILEIIQLNSTGYTSRTLEAIAYGKKLLTNNRYILEAPFYNSDYIEYFSSSEDIKEGFLKGLCKKEKVEYNYLPKLSPMEFLNFIDEKLAEQDKYNS